MSIFSISAFSQNLPNTLPDTGYVGVGTSTPTCNFQVVGTSQISGSLTVDSSITIADSARIDNNLRVNGHLFVGKNAYITDSTFTTLVRTKRITPFTGDSLIILGDSSLVINTFSHLIYPEADFDIPNPIIKGTGIGSPNITPNGDYSVALGHRINVDIIAKNSIAIGTGILPNGPYLQQYIPNTIMLGTNSNLPTLFIASANGINTTGKVGIATITPGINYESPDHIKLDVNGDARFYRNNNPNNYIRIGYNTNNAILDNFGNGNLLINYYGGKDVYIGTGTNKSSLHVGKNLFVCGKASIKELYVATDWCDYVFSDSYKPMDIQQKEQYYKLHKHLPNVPTALEVEKEGANVGESIKGILQNVEENRLDITLLYNMILELQQENKMLKEQLKLNR